MCCVHPTQSVPLRACWVKLLCPGWTQDLHTTFHLGTWLETQWTPWCWANPGPGVGFGENAVKIRATNTWSLALLWFHEHIHVTEPCSFHAAACPREGTSDQQHPLLSPCSQQGSNNSMSKPGWGSISELNPATPLHRWAGLQENQRWHPLTQSGSCAAAGDTSAPFEDGFPQQNPSSLKQTASMSNGLWMQQEKPAQPGRAGALLHCSAAMTVTKSHTELFVLNTKSIVVQ